MKRAMWLVMALSAGCATTSEVKETKAPVEGDARDAAAEAQLRAVLESWPACTPGAQAGALHVKATTCTKMFCGKACCNQCSWEAEFEGKNGVRQPVELARAAQLLKVSQGALECEVAAWAKVLGGVSLAIEEQACVVR